MLTVSITCGTARNSQHQVWKGPLADLLHNRGDLERTAGAEQGEARAHGGEARAPGETQTLETYKDMADGGLRRRVHDSRL